jgi:hypothetical protein
MADKEVSTGLTIEPALAGKWKWLDDKQLEFNPKDDWPVGAEHALRIDSTVVASHVKLARYDAKFKTPPFVAKVSKGQFYQDPTNPTLKKAVFDLNFSHPVNGAELEKRIELKLAGQSEGIWGVGRERTKFTVSYDKLKLNAYVHSENLATPQEDSSIELKVAEGAVSARAGTPFQGELAQTVKVPGQASLAITHFAINVAMNAKSEPEQVFTTTLSASTLEKDIKGATAAWLLPLHHPTTKKEDRRGQHHWNVKQDISE